MLREMVFFLVFFLNSFKIYIEQRLRHITKYTSLHEGDISFELALIMAGINIRFTDALKIYREMSDLKRLQKETFFKNVVNQSMGFDWAEKVLICVSMYGQMLIYKREFHNTADNYLAKLERIREEKRNCKRAGTCRRALDLSTPSPDTEVDYFGHIVPKSSGQQHEDFFDHLMNLNTNGIDDNIPYNSFFAQDNKHTTNFTKINQWLRYLVKYKDDSTNVTLNDEKVDKILPKNWKPIDFTKFTPNVLDRPLWDDIRESKGYPSRTTKKMRKNLFGEKGMDDKVKKELRDKYFKMMQGGFDPKREGIDIDLTDIV